MAQKIKIAELVADVRADATKLTQDVALIRRKIDSDSRAMSSTFNKNLQFKIAKMKIADLQKWHAKLRADFQRKLDMNVSSKSLDITRQKLNAVDNALRGTSQAGNDLARQSTKSASIFRSVWLRAVLALTAIRTAYTIFRNIAVGAKNAARDAEEVGNKFFRVYETIKYGASEAAKELSRSYGLADSTAKGLLSSTGDLLVGFGFTEKSALGLSLRANKLAADLASFQNIQGGVARASEAITKAMLGETEMVKMLGIVIRQDSKEFKENVKNMIEREGVTEKQARAIVILDEAYKQSKKSVGDFSRTQKELANQERIAAEEAKQLKEQIGRGLAPVFLSATKLAISFYRSLTENSLEKTIRKLYELGGALKDITMVDAANTIIGGTEEIQKLERKINSIKNKAKYKGEFRETLNELASGLVNAEKRSEILKSATLNLANAYTELGRKQAYGQKTRRDQGEIWKLEEQHEVLSEIIALMEEIDAIRAKQEVSRKVMFNIPIIETGTLETEKQKAEAINRIESELKKSITKEAELKIKIAASFIPGNIEYTGLFANLTTEQTRINMLKKELEEISKIDIKPTVKTPEETEKEKEVIGSYYDYVRYLDSNYISFKKDIIKQESDEILRATKSRMQAKIYYDAKLRELERDYINSIKQLYKDKNIITFEMRGITRKETTPGETIDKIVKVDIREDVDPKVWAKLYSDIDDVDDKQKNTFDHLNDNLYQSIQLATDLSDGFINMGNIFGAVISKMAADLIASGIYKGLQHISTLVAGPAALVVSPVESVLYALGLKGASGGTFTSTNSGVTKIPHFNAGTDRFTVPDGYMRDTFPVYLRSGETMRVTPTAMAGEEAKQLSNIKDSVQALTQTMVLLLSNNDKQKSNEIELRAKQNDLVATYDIGKKRERRNR